jgi:hypothetical protein
VESLLFFVLKIGRILFSIGFSMHSPSPHANLADIRRQLNEAQRTFDTLKMRPRESLRDFEYRVKRHSDKILSLKVAEQVQQQQIEQEAREAEELLKKKTP